MLFGMRSDHVMSGVVPNQIASRGICFGGDLMRKTNGYSGWWLARVHWLQWHKLVLAEFCDVFSTRVSTESSGILVFFPWVCTACQVEFGKNVIHPTRISLGWDWLLGFSAEWLANFESLSDRRCFIVQTIPRHSSFDTYASVRRLRVHG